MNLEARLKRVVDKDPDRYDPETIMRVHQFILWTEENPEKHKPWKGFEKIDDFELYYNTNPNLKERTSEELKKNKNGGNAFYRALLTICQIESKKTGKTFRELTEWMPRQLVDWSDFKTVEDFIKEYETNPNLNSKTYEELRKDKNGGNAFYKALLTICQIESEKTGKTFRELTEWLPRNNNDWSKFANIADFKKEYMTNPNLRGRTPAELMNDKKKGGKKFYNALRKFVTKISNGDDIKRASLMKKVLVYSNKCKHYNFRNSTIRFDSRPERIIAILLNKYGLLKRPEEGKNVHVKTNGDHQHSIDFLVGNTLIEYHPFNRKYDPKQGRNSNEEVTRYKFKNITNPKYSDHWFWHIWEIDDVYDILKDNAVNPLMNKRYQNLTKEQFEKHIDQAYDKARKYDITQEEENRRKTETTPYGIHAHIPMLHGQFAIDDLPSKDVANSDKEIDKKRSAA